MQRIHRRRLRAGPAVTALVTARGDIVLFVAAMLAGTLICDWVERRAQVGR